MPDNKKIIKSSLKQLPLKILLIAGLLVSAIFVFALITHEVIFEKDDLFDSRVIRFLNQYRTPWLINTMKFFTFFGSSQFLVPAYLFLITYYIIRNEIILGVHIALICITSTALSFSAKRIFHRARPELPLIQSLKTYSFPSGHAFSSFIFCSILAYLLWQANIQRVWKWVFSIFLLLFSFTIGVSRIVLRMHYATDVIAGFSLGLVWVIFSFYLLNRPQSKPRPGHTDHEKMVST